ncbi:MAG: FeoB-associated Cys-rich membrane protein [Bacteroidetes bacterium]|nr:FeoB-associated Cys-rich membrane protein [Bacteroidota bacterium]
MFKNILIILLTLAALYFLGRKLLRKKSGECGKDCGCGK